MSYRTDELDGAIGKGNYRLLNAGELEELFAAVKGRFFRDEALVKPMIRWVKSIEDFGDQEIRDVLKGTGLGLNDQVSAILMSEDLGVEVTFEALLDNFDVFWLPARDNLWVTDKGLARLFIVDHEEFVIFLASDEVAQPYRSQSP
jgi:hypothetical protein